MTRSWIDVLRAYTKGDKELTCPLCGAKDIEVRDVTSERGGSLEIQCRACHREAKFIKAK